MIRIFKKKIVDRSPCYSSRISRVGRSLYVHHSNCQMYSLTNHHQGFCCRCCCCCNCHTPPHEVCLSSTHSQTSSFCSALVTVHCCPPWTPYVFWQLEVWRTFPCAPGIVNEG